MFVGKVRILALLTITSSCAGGGGSVIGASIISSPRNQEICSRNFTTVPRFDLDKISVNASIKDCVEVDIFSCSSTNHLDEVSLKNMKYFAHEKGGNSIVYSIEKVKGTTGLLKSKEVIVNQIVGKILRCP